jgi:transposase-like protein
MHATNRWLDDRRALQGSTTAKRRAALVLSILRGETSVQEAARKHDLTVAEIEEWKDQFFLAAENALRSRPKDEEALNDEQIKKLARFDHLP